MMTVKEVAEKLQVCELTVFRNIYKNKIKAVKIGKSWRINEREVKRIMREGL